jgi:hypothetical protein
MTRDMDLVREILLAVERHPHGYAPEELQIEGYSSDQIGYHAYLMQQAGLVQGIEVTNLGSSGPDVHVLNLTWDGHEFLDAAREPKRWAQAKLLLHKAGGASFKVWTAVLTDLVKTNLGVGH